MSVTVSVARDLEIAIAIPERSKVTQGFATESIPLTGEVQLQREPNKAYVNGPRETSEVMLRVPLYVIFKLLFRIGRPMADCVRGADLVPPVW